MVAPLRLVDGRWPLEVELDQVLECSTTWVRDQGPKQVAIVDQSVAAIRDVLIAYGVDVDDRAQILAVIGGASLTRVMARAATDVGDPDKAAVAEVARHVMAGVGRLLHPGGRRWRLVMDGRPTTLNAERKGSRWERSADVAAWRRGFTVLAKQAKVPKLLAVSIETRPLFRNAASMQDVAACHPAVKAAIDGIRDAGVVPDDTPEHVTAITYKRPLVDRSRRVDGLEVVIHEDVAP